MPEVGLLTPISSDELIAKITEINGTSFLSEQEKKTLSLTVLQNFEQQEGTEIRQFVKVEPDRMRALMKRIRQDEPYHKDKNPKGRPMAAATVIDVLTILCYSMDETGRITATPKEVAEECGIDGDNFYRVRKYLAHLGVIRKGAPNGHQSKDTRSIYYGK